MQAQRKGLAAVFAAVEPHAATRICGYYTLSNYLIDGIALPDDLRKSRGLPRHSLCATLLGRLAVDLAFQHRRIGELLLIDALKRANRVSREIGSVCVVVQAKNARVAAYYERFGFVSLRDEARHLVMMMETIAQIADITSRQS